MSSEFDHEGYTYRVRPMGVMTQLHVSRRITPLILPMGPVLIGLNKPTLSPEAALKLLDPVASELTNLDDETVEYVIQASMVCLDRKQGDGWFPVWDKSQKVPMFQDIGLEAMMRLTYQVLADQLGPFIRGLLSKSNGAQRQESEPES